MPRQARLDSAGTLHHSILVTRVGPVQVVVCPDELLS